MLTSSRGLQLSLAKGLALSTALCVTVYIFSLKLVPDEVFYNSDSEHSAWIASVSNVFWLYPAVTGVYFIASQFSVGVAEEAMRAQNMNSRASGQCVCAYRTWLDYLCRLVLILNYTLICYALAFIPWIGSVIVFAVMCMVDGYFCFELVWSARGWTLEKRLRFCESHWSYLVGFGVPSTAISFFHPSGLLNMMLFSLGMSHADQCSRYVLFLLS